MPPGNPTKDVLLMVTAQKLGRDFVKCKSVNESNQNLKLMFPWETILHILRGREYNVKLKKGCLVPMRYSIPNTYICRCWKSSFFQYFQWLNTTQNQCLSGYQVCNIISNTQSKMESTKGSMKFLSETHALKIDLNKRGHYLHTYNHWTNQSFTH